MYTQNSIEDVRNADIVQVIGNFLDLKRKGKIYSAKSPFSDDKTASFTVTPSLNIFKCFSSNIGGDAIKFVMLHKHQNFFEAVKTVADICGITLQEEEVTEEVKRKISYRQELFQVNADAVTQFQKQLAKLDESHWAKQMLAKRQFSDDVISKFNIGFAPKNYQFLTDPFIEKGKLEPAKTVGLVKSKEGRSYDFFIDRLIFPIEDIRGNVAGFGGRQNDGVDGPKYLNSTDSEIYNKSQLLYGLYQNKESIAKSRACFLVEGYTDVTGLFQNGVPLAIANCGTANLSKEQMKEIHRFADHLIILKDNDGLDKLGNEQKGTLSAMKEIDNALSQGFKVSIIILPEGEDPDSFARSFSDFVVMSGEEEKTQEIKANALKAHLFALAQDAVIWKTEKLRVKAVIGPDEKSQAVRELAEMLSQIKDDIKKGDYIERCRKILKVPAQAVKKQIISIVEVAELKASMKGTAQTKDAEMMGLPDGADYKLFFEKGYVPFEQSVYFRGRDKFFKGSNFKITPLFHVYGKQDNKRLCEVVSEFGKKKLIDFDTSDFVQMAKFEGKLLDEGNFTFMPEVNPNHFKLLRNDILEHFTLAYELKTLGWQKEGFYAYSDCAFHEGIRKTANEYGIIQLETGVKTESDYMEDVKHFYSPSASVMHKFAREGDDEYENDRYVIYKEAPCSINDWMRQLKKVYGKKAHTGLAFVFAAVFRDILYKRKGFFPHFFLTGEKGSGKSKFAESLVAIFTYKQDAFDLNSGSPVAFQRRLARVANIASMFEEYNDAIPDVRKQALKGAYDGRGRELGKKTNDDRTTTTKVRCALILLSQYLSAWDDNALTIRSVIENFIKKQDPFTTQEIDNYSLLKEWEEKGLTSMLTEILKHRELMEAEMFHMYEKLNKKMIGELKGKPYEERMMQNYIALLTPVTILKDKFNFPFDEADLWNDFKNAILDSSDLISESEGLAEFWRALEFLLDSHRIKAGTQFIIDTPLEEKLMARKGEEETVWPNTSKTQVLYLRLNAVHQLYHKEISTREGVDVINENTLKNYFRSKKYYIGVKKSKRFDDTSTSAYLFDYKMMHEMGVLNLTREFKAEPFTPQKPDLFVKNDDSDLDY